jgi:hypothetical protein
MKGTKGLSFCSSDLINFSRSIRQGVVLAILRSEESHENVGCLYGQFFRYFVSFNFKYKYSLSIVTNKIMKPLYLLYCICLCVCYPGVTTHCVCICTAR